MKLACPRNILSTAYQTASGVVPSRTPKSILQSIKMQATGTEVVLFGTDEEVGIRIALSEAQIEKPGEILLPSARTLAILRDIQGDTLQFEARGDRILIRGERSEYSLASQDPAEFPAVTTFSETSYFEIAPELLRQLIRRTLFATDTENTRYALGGVLIEAKPDSLTFAATDTRRLAVAKGSCTVQGAAAAEVSSPVLPTKALSLIERSLSGVTTPVHLAVRNNDALFRAASTTIYTRLVEGRFPHYRDVIPADGRLEIPLTAGLFHSVVRQSQIVTNEESRGVDFMFKPGTLTLQSRAADVGESSVELPISYEGDEFVITFDPRFVADFLKVLDPEQPLRLWLNDSESPGVFRTEDGYTYVVMPLARDR